jgi:hypothetical protein
LLWRKTKLLVLKNIDEWILELNQKCITGRFGRITESDTKNLKQKTKNLIFACIFR